MYDGGRPVAIARVLVYVAAGLCVLAALGSAAGALVTVSVTGAFGTSGYLGGGLGEAAASFGTVLASWFAFWAFVAALVAWLWFWVGGALRRGHRGARVVATALCGLALLVGGPPIVMIAGEDATLLGVVLAMAVVAMPAATIVLLWGPPEARRHFGDPVHDPQPITAPLPVPGPPPITAWESVPASVRCAACGADAAPTDTRCARCGLPLAAAADRPRAT